MHTGFETVGTDDTGLNETQSTVPSATIATSDERYVLESTVSRECRGTVSETTYGMNGSSTGVVRVSAGSSPAVSGVGQVTIIKHRTKDKAIDIPHTYEEEHKRRLASILDRNGFYTSTSES
jgi:hypothetical protein